MTLRQQQSKFAHMIALLILHAEQLGYEVTFGDAWAKTGHIDGSFHYKRLALDLNLFKGGRYLRSTKAHQPLGEYWESIGGTWGGRFTRKDGNHYSLGET
ncbi:MAG: M15 family metallopeptidase [Candidatus Sedimenticola sp. (ex Thyasira tokunagai)]